MAAKTGPRTGKSSSRTSARGKRVPSKPLIIDVEADKAAKPSKKPSPVAASVAPKTTTSAGLDEATARAAGLSASGPAARSTAQETATPATPSPAAQTPSSTGASPDEAATPRPFVLAAAGFIGALAALALMFLAQLLGLVSVPNGQADAQLATVLALEERVDTRLAALDVAEPAQAETDFAPIEADIAALRQEIDVFTASSSSDAAPVDVQNVIAEALAPLEERIGAIEAVIQFPALPSDEPVGEAVQPDPATSVDPEELAELRALLETSSSDIAALRSDLGALRVDVETLASAENPEAAQVAALDDRLAQMSSDTADRLAALSSRIAQLDEGMAVMGEELTAFEQAPVAAAPDQLARLGLALDGLADARDSGTGLANALAAAQVAAAFDPGLSGALAPLSGAALDNGVSDAALLTRYENATDAMLAAAPGSAANGNSILGALGERARQMVTIRASGDALNASPGTVTGQIDQLGSLIASGQYDAALAAFDGLPDAVKVAGADVRDALNARVSLDNALIQARSGLLAALASSNQ